LDLIGTKGLGMRKGKCTALEFMLIMTGEYTKEDLEME